MIKTTTRVPVPTSVEIRDYENKTIYAEIKDVKVVNGQYIIRIEEFVYDTTETIDPQTQESTTFEQKRHICYINRVRTKQEISQLISYLKTENLLSDYNLSEQVNIEEIPDIIENIIKTAHLIENNQDMIRQTNWVEVIQ